MAQYLIGMYQPDGIVPPPEFLAPIMARLGELTQEMQKENVWVFAGGLHDASTGPSTATGSWPGNPVNARAASTSRGPSTGWAR